MEINFLSIFSLLLREKTTVKVSKQILRKKNEGRKENLISCFILVQTPRFMKNRQKIVLTSVLGVEGFDAVSTVSATTLPLPTVVISLAAIPSARLEAPYRFQNPGFNDSAVCLISI